MFHWIQLHPVMSTVASYWLFSSIVGALPTPGDKDGNGYKFFFALMHGLAANLLRIPQVRNILNGGSDKAQGA